MLPSVSVPTPIGAEAGRDAPCPCPNWTRTGSDRARTGSSSARRASSSPTSIATTGSWPTRSGWSCRRSRRRPRAAASTRKASVAGRLSASASEPAELTMPTTSMLSFSSTGMPCSGPRTLPRPAFGVERVGLGQGLRVDLDDRVQPRARVVDGRDAVQIGLGQRVRRERAGGHAVARLGGGQLDDVGRSPTVQAPAARTATNSPSQARPSPREPRRDASRDLISHAGHSPAGRQACAAPSAARGSCRRLRPGSRARAAALVAATMSSTAFSYAFHCLRLRQSSSVSFQRLCARRSRCLKRRSCSSLVMCTQYFTKTMPWATSCASKSLISA